MTRQRDITRRSFVRAAAAAAVAPGIVRAAEPELGWRAAAPAWPGYDRAIVIDCLASPGYFNYPLDPPLTDAMIRNAVESGITAVNLTVSRGDFESTARRIARWDADVAAHPAAFARVRTVEDLLDAKRTGRLGIVFGFQDTTPIDRDLHRVGVFHDFGVRIVQLTYNVRNLVGDGCLEPGNAGLSTFGREVVGALNEAGIVVDLSHCGQRTTADGIAASAAPVAITHSGCAAVAPHPRSKQDAELRAMAEGGGVIGIYLMPFLSPGRPSTADDVVAHVEHAVNVCGEDHVGIGSDLSTTPIDGSDEYWAAHRTFVARRIEQGIAAPAEDPDVLFMVEDLNSPRRMEMIADRLSARGHPDARIEKILGANFLRLFREVWKG